MFIAARDARLRTVFVGMILGLLALGAVAEPAGAYELRVVNVSRHTVSGYPAVVQTSELPERFSGGTVRIVGPDGGAVPCQADDLDGDGNPDELVFLVELAAGPPPIWRWGRISQS